jgi:hypothetical protein
MIQPTSLRPAAPSPESGVALLAALITLLVLTTVAASIFMASMPAYRGTYQASAYQQAKLAADAGVDYAISQLQNSVPKTNAYTWPGWTLSDGTTPVTPPTDVVRMSSPADIILARGGDGNNNARLGQVQVDVITRDTNFTKNPWYRIRSTGIADLPSSQLSMDKRDLFLRRMTLNPVGGVRPHITRTVEVIARPVYLFEYALKTKAAMTLGGSQNWTTDSYDSRYPAGGIDPSGNLVTDPRSTSTGLYSSMYSRSNGNIASDLARPASSPYGMLINANGAVVKGQVQTNGGDDPNTPAHENVYQSTGINQNTITDNFYETLTPVTAPAWATAGTAALNLVSPTTVSVPASGSTDPLNPYTVSITTNGKKGQGGFTVTNPDNGNHYVDIYVNADISLTSQTIIVAPGMHVNLYLNGSISFGNNDVNFTAAGVTPASSGVPGDLLIYGVADPNSNPMFQASGNGRIDCCFYGPQYTTNLSGDTAFIGSFTLNNYSSSGGGGGTQGNISAGFHYDEALGVMGPIKYYKAVSYFEDTRKDLE